MSGKMIGRYEIRGELGRGGMATVYLAYDPVLEREVALKVLPTYFAHEPEFSARFATEAKTVAALEHNAIVSMYDYGEDGEWPYFVMQIMKGGSLKEKIEQGTLSVAEAAAILKRVGSALDRAHSRNLIHRDLKPGNIMFDEDDDAYLTDFGIVKLAEGSENFTQTGNTLGTPAYMSPEQARGVEVIDARSDIYALGVILYEMLTGDVPYKSETTIGQAMMHIMEPVPQILEAKADLPEAIQAVIDKAMAKKREERYETAGALAKAVAAVADGRATAVAVPEVAPATPPPEPEPEPVASSPKQETETTSPPPKPESVSVPVKKEVATTKTADAPPPTKKGGIPTWVYAIVGLVVVAIIAVFALSGGDEGENSGDEIAGDVTGDEQVEQLQDEPEPEPTDEPEEEEPSIPTVESNETDGFGVLDRIEEGVLAEGDTISIDFSNEDDWENISDEFGEAYVDIDEEVYVVSAFEPDILYQGCSDDVFGAGYYAINAVVDSASDDYALDIILSDEQSDISLFIEFSPQQGAFSAGNMDWETETWTNLTGDDNDPWEEHEVIFQDEGDWFTIEILLDQDGFMSLGMSGEVIIELPTDILGDVRVCLAEVSYGSDGSATVVFDDFIFTPFE